MTTKQRALDPTLELELSTFQRFRAAGPGSACLVAGMDEVGRGALAGNVTVGCVVIDPSCVQPLAGVRDSKLVSEKTRSALVEPIKDWANGHGVGHASAQEIDEHGITMALRLAGHRALKRATAKLGTPHHILLDGNSDWLTPQVDLFTAVFDHEYVDPCPPVQTVLKGDLTCLSIAAASILAKVERDEMLVRLDAEHPEYGWKENKGYGSAAHRDAIKNHGVSPHHRQSWLTKILTSS